MKAMHLTVTEKKHFLFSLAAVFIIAGYVLNRLLPHFFRFFSIIAASMCFFAWGCSISKHELRLTYRFFDLEWKAEGLTLINNSSEINGQLSPRPECPIYFEVPQTVIETMKPGKISGHIPIILSKSPEYDEFIPGTLHVVDPRTVEITTFDDLDFPEQENPRIIANTAVGTIIPSFKYAKGSYFYSKNSTGGK